MDVPAGGHAFEDFWKWLLASWTTALMLAEGMGALP